ncbi:unnamed protein product [Clonostachys rhizophaga]|uniref:Uncharacterized protein n=1 Tax=Clonostachys rhizophaga TaxID=160324 RepID=A0A9N9VEB8_9HYPO|nr:unnamed protein product [Clonostachys rhizophaga]
MASLQDDPIQSIKQLGYFYQKDAELGRRVDAILAKVGYYFKNKPGLTFAKVNTFQNEVYNQPARVDYANPLKQVRDIIESLFEQCSLGLFKSYGPGDDDYCILNRLHSELRVLIVILWASDSSVAFHSCSHKYLLNANKAPIGLLRIPPDKLAIPEITRVNVNLDKGGLRSILDGRVGFRIMSGQAIFLGFVAPDELQHWAKMTLPKLVELQEIVREMQTQSNKIGTNFEFKEPRDSNRTH